jgi:membrane protein DedA with SNARE-associated domain
MPNVNRPRYRVSMRDHPWAPADSELPAAIPAAAMAAAAVILVPAALTGAPGSVLVALALLVAAGLAGVAVVFEQRTPAVIACVLVATALVGALGMDLGGRAGRSADQGAPFPAVVGMKLDRAKRLFQQHGPVQIVVQRASYGERNVVLRATGYGPHGTYGPGSTIRLVVGTRAPR